MICSNCNQAFEGKISGKVDQRPGLKRALNFLKAGDTLVVWKLDRLGRSIKHLISLISELEDKGIHFHSLTDSINTSTRGMLARGYNEQQRLRTFVISEDYNRAGFCSAARHTSINRRFAAARAVVEQSQ